MAKHAPDASFDGPDVGHATRPIVSAAPATPDPWFLLAEERHRTKNLFQLLNSLLNRAIGSATASDNAALRRVQAQLAGFGLLNDMLSGEAHDGGIPCCAQYLAAVAELVEASCLAPQGTKLDLVTPSALPADATMCRYLGLILTELLFNAAKHAFPDGGGTVFVRLGITTEHLHLHVSDDGVGSNKGASHPHSGQGRTFIETLARAVRGTVECRSSPLGSMCDIRVPLPNTQIATVAAPSPPGPISHRDRSAGRRGRPGADTAHSACLP